MLEKEKKKELQGKVNNSIKKMMFKSQDKSVSGDGVAAITELLRKSTMQRKNSIAGTDLNTTQEM